ncbi:DUF1801 domain-containing protein [Pseudomonas sp. UFMG81]|uniref:DUF1801 domain-containing protein n=1 Tax=Pseudomonas sp. UFMG81 TaxID=2745936 RepID=UPI00188FF5B5|nr:DUF1801 domain-containing protein [Pseudomonas sp. UFMG81]
MIDARIAALTDWRGRRLAHIRALIRKADPVVREEIKWLGTPVWCHAGIICTGECYKDKLKLTFLNGAHLDDPAGLFNASLDGGKRRAIDLFEGDRLNERAFIALIRATVVFNLG